MDPRPTSHPAVVRRPVGQRKRVIFRDEVLLLPLCFPEPGAIEQLFREAKRKRAA